MRGTDETSGSLFSYVDLEERIPARHPLRKIRQVVNDALASLDAEFEALYTDLGRPSIPPERLIRASLLQILFSVRSERQLMEQMDYNLLFRWFVGLGIDDPVWVPTVFTKNRDRLLTTEMSRKVMAAILAHREVTPLLSDEHFAGADLRFSVDGTLIKAWASMKSFQPKAEAALPDDEGPGDPPAPDTTLEPAPSQTPAETDPMPRNSRRHRNAEVDFRGEKRSNATHASTTDPDARLYKKSPGTGAMPCFMGHAPLNISLCAKLGKFHPALLGRLHPALTIDRRTTRHEGYALSQKHRKKIEEAFCWAKTVGGMAQTMYRGVERVRSRFIPTMAANNLARLPRLLAV